MPYAICDSIKHLSVNNLNALMIRISIMIAIFYSCNSQICYYNNGFPDFFYRSIEDYPTKSIITNDCN